MAKHFKNLKTLKLDNTSLLEKLKANELIESVSLLNSNILSINSFKKKVPEPLLTRNNMANYTQVKVNGVPLSESEIAKLKLGKMNIEHNDRIEVIDGILAGTIFTIIIGTPLNELIKDQVLLVHIKELLNKESVSSLVSLYELQTITWIGKNPDEVTELNYLGYFNTKTIGNMETFKNDLKQLPNLQYINLAGAFFTNNLNLNEFNITNFKYSFADCTALQNIVLDKTVTNLEGTFRNCQNLKTVTVGENANLSNMIKTFYGCKGILNFTIDNPNMTDTDNPNVFEESLISTLTFTKEPVENTITSNLLKYAIYSSSTLNLDNKNRPDLYNLTFSENIVLENISLNNTNTEIFDLTLENLNFSNLKTINLNNTLFLRKIKLKGININSVTTENSGIREFYAITPGTPAFFTDNKNYYYNLSLNNTPLNQLEMESVKNGTFVFSDNDSVTFLNGVFNQLTMVLKIGIPITGLPINEVFQDPTLADYIRIKTNKTTINDIIIQADLDKIIYFGYDGLQSSSSTTSWFKGKTVNSWEGVELLKNIQNVYLNGVLGTANNIVINSKEIKTLYYAFRNCTSLTSITLPTELPNLTSLSYAFNGCASLTSITLPTELPNLTSLSYAFSGCASLTGTIVIPSTPKLTTFVGAFNNTKFEIIEFKNLDSITTMSCYFVTGSSLNEKPTHVKKIILPASMPKLTNMTELCCYSSSSLTTLEEIVLPTSMPLVTTLSYAFYNCTSLTSITLPTELPNLTSLSYAFNGCASLTSITLPTELPNLTSLSYAFSGCASLTGTIVIPPTPKLTTFVGAFNNTKFEIIEFKNLDSITTMSRYFVTGSGSTNKPTHIKKIILPASMPKLTNMNELCCYSSSSSLTTLEEIVLPTSMPLVTTLSYAFYNCTSLTSITLPTELPNLTSLSYAFNGCTALTSITLPTELPNLTSLSYAFSGCASLTGTIVIPPTPKLTTFVGAFNNTKFEIIEFKNLDSITTMFRYFVTDSGSTNKPTHIKKIILPASMPKLTNMNELCCYSSSYSSYLTTLEEIVLPTSMPLVTTLSYAFRNCTSLTSVSLPPILPKLTTSLANTYLEGADRTYIYHANPEVDDIQKITLHPSIGTKDYSKLTNLLTFGQAFLDDVLSQYIYSKINLNLTELMDSSKLSSLIELIDFPNGINNFEGLKYCKNLEYVSFKNNVNYRVINLKHCFNLKRLSESFSGCINLENLELPDNLENITDYKNVIFNCPKISRLCIPNIKNKKSLNLILKELDIENKTLELKGNLNRFDNFNIIKNIIKANIIFSNEIYNRPLDFYFKPKLKEIIKEKLALTEENPNITKSQLDTITELVLNTELEGDLELAILTNLTTLTVNKSLNLLNLKYAKKIDNITFNNCIKLKELFLAINNNCVKDINLTITGANNLVEIYANKGINLDYPEFKKNL